MTDKAIAPQPIAVAEVVDNSAMTVRRWGMIMVCFAVALLDGFDTQSIAFIGPSIADDFGMSLVDITWVITASTIGMAIGAVTLGTLGDRIGRKRTVIIALAIFGAFSLVAAQAHAPWQIVATRFAIGLGMGGATPALLALAAEYSPERRRGLCMTLVLLGLPGGAMLGGFVATAWLPVLGWRGIFMLGGALPLIMIVIIALACPESPSYLIARGGPAAQERARRLLSKITATRLSDTQVLIPEPETSDRGSLRTLFAPQYRATTLIICAIYLTNWIAWYLLLQWLPTALTVLGLSKPEAARGTITINAAFIAFAIPISLLMYRVPARRLLVIMFATGIAITLAMAGTAANWPVLFVLIALAGFGVGGPQLVLNYLIAWTYPTQLRGTATGFGIGFGRLGSIVGSALGGVLLSSIGPTGYFAWLAIPLAVALAATLALRTRKPATAATRA